MSHRNLRGRRREVLCLPFAGVADPLPQDWHVEPVLSHHSSSSSLPPSRQRVERQRGGQQLLGRGGFRTRCARDELTLCINLPTPEEARRLLPEAEGLSSDMHGAELLLLEQFVEKDYGDDMLLLTATEEKSGHLVGLIFWRYLCREDDPYWEQVNINPAAAGHGLTVNRWTLIELLCTDRAYRGHGVGKLLLVTALAYSVVKDGRTAAVLTLGRDDERHENTAARQLYGKLGFEEMPEDAVVARPRPGSPSPGSPGSGPASPRTVDPGHVLVVWDIQRSLRQLTLLDVSGIREGTRVPQLEAVAQAGCPMAEDSATRALAEAPTAEDSGATRAPAAEELSPAGPEERSGGEEGLLRRLDPGACVAVVRGLTGS